MCATDAILVLRYTRTAVFSRIPGKHNHSEYVLQRRHSAAKRHECVRAATLP